MNLPKDLEQKRDELADDLHWSNECTCEDLAMGECYFHLSSLYKDELNFKRGFDACWDLLLELSNEDFDESECQIAAENAGYNGDGTTLAFHEGANYQHQKVLAEVLALKEDLNQQLIAFAMRSIEMTELKAENEQLRWAKVSEKILKDSVLLLTKENEELKLKGPALMKECVRLREENELFRKLLSGEEVSLMCDSPGYSAIFKMDSDETTKK